MPLRAPRSRVAYQHMAPWCTGARCALGQVMPTTCVGLFRKAHPSQTPLCGHFLFWAGPFGRVPFDSPSLRPFCRVRRSGLWENSLLRPLGKQAALAVAFFLSLLSHRFQSRQGSGPSVCLGAPDPRVPSDSSSNSPEIPSSSFGKGARNPRFLLAGGQHRAPQTTGNPPDALLPEQTRSPGQPAGEHRLRSRPWFRAPWGSPTEMVPPVPSRVAALASIQPSSGHQWGSDRSCLHSVLVSTASHLPGPPRCPPTASSEPSLLGAMPSPSGHNPRDTGFQPSDLLEICEPCQIGPWLDSTGVSVCSSS